MVGGVGFDPTSAGWIRDSDPDRGPWRAPHGCAQSAPAFAFRHPPIKERPPGYAPVRHARVVVSPTGAEEKIPRAVVVNQKGFGTPATMREESRLSNLIHYALITHILDSRKGNLLERLTLKRLYAIGWGMSMSDCPRCWNTPCTCGYMGYSVTFNPEPSPYQLDQEKNDLHRQINKLRDELEKLKKVRIVRRKKP